MTLPIHVALIVLPAMLLCASAAEPRTPKDLVYRVPGMDKVTIRSNLVYKTDGDLVLEADLYLPPGSSSNAALPVIIFVLGDASPEALRHAKDWRCFRSYGQLAAASGFAGVTFNHRSHQNFTHLAEVRSDIENLVQFVRANASALSLDKNRLCLWFFSGSGPHLSVAMGTNAAYVKCLVAYYPVLGVPPHVINAAEYSSVTQLQKHVLAVPPTLIAKAARDSTYLNRMIDSFRQQAQVSHLPLKFLEHPRGRHAFDIVDDDDTSRAILHDTIKFVAQSLEGIK